VTREFYLGRLGFNDFPRPRPLEDYQREKARFVDYFKRHSDVKAIYEMGSVKDPGISDLDLILVLSPKCRLTTDDLHFLDSLDPYLFAHRPFVISDTLFPFAPYLFFASNLNKLWGEDYVLLRPDHEPEPRQLAWLLAAEAAVGRLFDLVFQAAWGQGVSLRGMLLKLNSIKHNINLSREFTGESHSFDEFISEVTALRSQWFLLPHERALAQVEGLISDGLNILLEIIGALAREFQALFGRSGANLGPWLGTGHFLCPNSLQILKFESLERPRLERLSNPLAFLRRPAGSFFRRLVRHINDISIVGLPFEFMVLFWPVWPDFSETTRTLQEGLVVQGKGDGAMGYCEKGLELIRRRHLITDEYRKFLQENGLSGFSVLVMGPWYMGNRARFFEIKKWLLRHVAHIPAQG